MSSEFLFKIFLIFGVLNIPLCLMCMYGLFKYGFRHFGPVIPWEIYEKGLGLNKKENKGESNAPQN